MVIVFLSSNTLVELLNNEIQINEGKEIVYAETNLGFVLERENNISNSLKYLQNGQVIGECIWIVGKKNKLNKICEKLGMVITNTYCVGERQMLEGYSALLSYQLKGTNKNIQIAITDEKIVVGSPIIYGSY